MNRLQDTHRWRNSVVSIFALLLLFGVTGCGNESGSGDAPSAEASAEPASMFDGETALGQKVQSNGYGVDNSTLDKSFSETMQCLGVSDVPSDIYVVLKEPYSAFPCVPLPNGCGGLFDLDNGVPVITVTADLVRLKHEYIHYMLYYTTGDPDSSHETDYYNQCA